MGEVNETEFIDIEKQRSCVKRSRTVRRNCEAYVSDMTPQKTVTTMPCAHCAGTCAEKGGKQDRWERE
jgi:hypothetical protein